jgi:hypothetical protein
MQVVIPLSVLMNVALYIVNGFSQRLSEVRCRFILLHDADFVSRQH